MHFSTRLIRISRGILLSFAVFITLVGILVVEENWRGDRAWQATLKEYANRGDPLDTLPPDPPPIPAEKNFLQTPLFSQLLFAKAESAEAKAFEASTELPSLGSISVSLWRIGRSTDLAATAKEIDFFRANRKLLLIPDSSDSASRILAQYRAADRYLAGLRQAAFERPFSRIVRSVQPKIENLFGTEIPHHDFISRVGRDLSVQACAFLVKSDAEAACQNALANLQLAYGFSSQPYTLLEVMLAGAQINVALQPVWEGLHQHAWTDDQLARISQQLRQIHLLNSLQRSLLIERNGLVNLPDETLAQEVHLRALRYLARGVWQQNKIFYLHELEPALQSIGEHSTPSFLPNFINRSERATPLYNYKPYQILAIRSLFHFRIITLSVVYSANAVNLATTACALERHRLAHGMLPETLAPLVPAYLPAVPIDVINGAPLHYTRHDDGTFTLYSVGADGDDDGGKRLAKTDSNSIATSTGDWCW